MPNTATIYINLEDDVSKIAERLKREKAVEVVLVCPKRCFLFSDSINLRLLKKQTDVLKKDVSILTMDERGQVYAKEAGFKLKFLPKAKGGMAFSDIRLPRSSEQLSQQPAEPEPVQPEAVPEEEKDNIFGQAAKGLKSAVKNFAAPVIATVNIKEQAKEPEVEEPAVAVIEQPEPQYPKEFGLLAKPDGSLGKRHNGMFITLAVFSVLVILAVMFVVLPEAEVVVYGRTEPITRDLENVGLSINIDEPDIGKLHLPATRVIESVEKTEQFQSQGKKEMGNQASGTVRIYNFTGAPISLRASTTVLNIGNKEYVLTEDVNYYRPTTYSNAQTKEVNQSSLGDPVGIKAREGGESYNAPSGTRMEINNKVFGSRPLLLYAVVDSPLANGTSRFLSLVDEKDFSAAQAALGSAVIKEVQAKLSQRDLILLDKAYLVETTSFTTDKPTGTETPNFNATLKVKVTGLAFKKSELENLVEGRIIQTVSGNSTLKMSDSQMTYSMTSVDLTTGIGALLVHFEGKAVPDMDLENIEQELTGKSKDEASEIIRKKADVERIEMTLLPSWQKKFPWLPGKIHVKVVE